MLLFVTKSSKCFLRRRIWRRMANVSDLPYLPSPWPPKEAISKDLSIGVKDVELLYSSRCLI